MWLLRMDRSTTTVCAERLPFDEPSGGLSALHMGMTLPFQRRPKVSGSFVWVEQTPFERLLEVSWPFV